MILTYKVKHNRDFSIELKKARQIAKFALRTHSLSSKSVKHYNLPSAISNQILRKYSKSKTLKEIKSVKLTVPSQSIKLDQVNNLITIKCLKLQLNYQFPNTFTKINQVEIGNQYAYVSVSIEDAQPIQTTNTLGIDRNTVGHCAVCAMPHNGKVIKLGKSAFHTHRKYKKIRQHLQFKNAKKKLKRIRKREDNIIRDINHKVSKKIVQIAKQNNCTIKLEKLGGIRKGKRAQNSKKNKNGESFKTSINTWTFYQLQTMIEYKAKICGIPVIYIDPRYTSQRCSRCGQLGNRNNKKYTCTHCGHVDHADSNAAFNIANSESLVGISKITSSNDQSLIDRDVNEGNTDIPQLETRMARTPCV